MADHVKTISVGLNLLGQGPAELWASTTTAAHALIWGSAAGGNVWGEGSEDIPQYVTHYPATSAIPATSVVSPYAYFVRTFTAGDLGPTSTVAVHVQFYKAIAAGSITPTSDPSNEGLGDAAGYVRLFPGGISNGENRTWDESTAVSDQTSTYAEASEPTTTWTEA